MINPFDLFPCRTKKKKIIGSSQSPFSLYYKK